VLRGEITPAEVFNGVNLVEYRKAAEGEKQGILDALEVIKKNLLAVEEPVIEEVNSHLRESKKKLEANGKNQLDNLRNDTGQLLLRTYPCIRARNALEALLEFMDEFEKTMV